MKPRIHLITLGVKDLEKSRAFYVDGLGWTPSPASQGDVIFIQLGGLVLSLYPYQSLAADAKVQPGRGKFTGITLAHNAGSEAEVDRIMKEAEAAGARIEKEAAKVFWGGYSGYFCDPDGYLWEVAFNPFFPFDKDGNVKLP